MFHKREVLLPNHRFINRNYEKFLLVGDIGGTFTRLSLLGIENKNPVLLFVHYYLTKEVQDFSLPVNDTLEYADKHYLISTDTAVLAVAGVVSPDRRRVRLSSNGLEISAEGILKKTLLKNVLLLNDFEALGYAVPYCKNVFQLNQVKKENGNIAVIGAGTGLGVVLVVDGKVVASEAGHLDLAVETQEEYKILEFLKKKGKTDVEALVSGMGLLSLYEFFSGKKLQYSHHTVLELTSSLQKDSSARKAVETFVRFYGRFAGNIALVNLPRGGLYLAGGVTPNIVSHMKQDFMQEFERKVSSKNLKDQIPVFLMHEKNLALIGSAAYYLQKPVGASSPHITEEDVAYPEKLMKQGEYKPLVLDKPGKDYFDKEPKPAVPQKPAGLPAKPAEAKQAEKPVGKLEEKKEAKALAVQQSRALAENE